MCDSRTLVERLAGKERYPPSRQNTVLNTWTSFLTCSGQCRVHNYWKTRYLNFRVRHKGNSIHYDRPYSERADEPVRLGYHVLEIILAIIVHTEKIADIRNSDTIWIGATRGRQSYNLQITLG